MSVESNGKVERPNHPLPRSYVEPILFLAHEMAKKDRVVPVPDQRMVDRLAKEIGIDAQQMRKWFHGMTDEQAIRKLDLELAKKGALVVLALILKADTTGGDQGAQVLYPHPHPTGTGTDQGALRSGGAPAPGGGLSGGLMGPPCRGRRAASMLPFLLGPLPASMAGSAPVGGRGRVRPFQGRFW